MEVRVPPMGESVAEASLMTLVKKGGEFVKEDEVIAVLETDKINVEVYSPVAGILGQWAHAVGDVVKVDDVLVDIQESAAPPASASASNQEPLDLSRTVPGSEPMGKKGAAASAVHSSPAATKIIAESGLDAGSIQGTGKGGMVTKADVVRGGTPVAAPVAQPAGVAAATSGNRGELRVKMSRLRQRVAERLKYSQNTAAILTTFNEVDMTNVIALRNKHKEDFEKKHGIKLGFMSFFVQAAISALKAIPNVNASIDGSEIVYHEYVDMGVAISAEQGLVVPVLRSAQEMSFAAIEKSIVEYGKKARAGGLSLDDITGGTFTVSNGGVFGSLLSTPIINPPQTAILGMHKTQDRPVALNGQVVIRPMMYIALSYDHRLIDGKEAVSFLVHVKNKIEDPVSLLLDI
jgi:2-oxoglutarate dehydrogenase E2 component (dihydrolipoamide succinyltransferase)